VRLEVQGDDELAIEDGLFEMNPEFVSKTDGFDVLDVEIRNCEAVS
jgi:hypothetical protein